RFNGLWLDCLGRWCREATAGQRRGSWHGRSASATGSATRSSPISAAIARRPGGFGPPFGVGGVGGKRLGGRYFSPTPTLKRRVLKISGRCCVIGLLPDASP